jgi:KDO2-lipid IV(A) lauroyltransferase
MIKALKNNNPLGMAGDLNVPHDNLFVDFFGKKAVVGQGLATFTIKRRAPLIFIWSVRVSPFRYKGYLKRIYYQLTGDEKTDLQHLAQLISTELEDKIRQHPHQYFWFNRRWKTRPPDDPNAVY